MIYCISYYIVTYYYLLYIIIYNYIYYIVFDTLKAFSKPLTVRFLYKQGLGPFALTLSFIPREWSFILIFVADFKLRFFLIFGKLVVLLNHMLPCSLTTPRQSTPN